MADYDLARQAGKRPISMESGAQKWMTPDSCKVVPCTTGADLSALLDVELWACASSRGFGNRYPITYPSVLLACFGVAAAFSFHSFAFCSSRSTPRPVR